VSGLRERDRDGCYTGLSYCVLLQLCPGIYYHRAGYGYVHFTELILVVTSTGMDLFYPGDTVTFTFTMDSTCTTLTTDIQCYLLLWTYLYLRLNIIAVHPVTLTFYRRGDTAMRDSPTLVLVA
jgi:hypothetical protein